MNTLASSVRALIMAGGLALAAPLPVSGPALAQEQSWQLTDGSAVDAVIETYVDNGALPFLYVRLEDAQGDVVYEHAAQNSDLVSAPVDGDTWLRVWSMSKIVTISAALDMIEDGVLRFDDPVTDYIPEFSDLTVATGPNGENLAEMAGQAWGDEAVRAALEAMPCPLPTVPVESVMTVRDLLNHTGGFYYTFQPTECLNAAMGAQDIGAARSSDELIADLAALPLISQPGAGYYYGMNTTVLGLVMERAAGQSLQEIVRERITGPLAIDDLRYGLPEGEEMLPRVTGKGGTLQVTDPSALDIYRTPPQGYDPDVPLYLGGEGMIGTSAAYADFLHMLLGRGTVGDTRILEEITIEALSSPHTQLGRADGYNGYNLWVSDGLWIGGGYEGTHFWVDPQRGLIGLVMSQVHSRPAAGNGVNDAVRGALYEQLEKAGR
ncbi:serine hydrolase domain-containing protein [Aquisalinus flavus]|uniref:Serine hydrolase n=1 Tax=Aquisalinus flavus TaxID=1526572 RepID=A0A8J2V5N9_9PROT|nr:serine hydrolase domain-containing protein [Aquisalinus flavus]MBD0426787.1 beta-lactamase family protein [Aquisalinus flavus]UNE46638.1 beta-lactamase family protein [Aquisalinus flavus]GGC95992.1 serine hydrolase [Aquisalinus flavus]